MKPRAIIVDLDGTICKNVTGRPWYGKGAAEGMLKDEPYRDIIDMINIYSSTYELQVIILTGRHQGKELDATKHWLYVNDVNYDIIYTRDSRDYSKSAVYKEKVYTEEIEPYYDVVLVFEDDESCVEMFKSKGLTVLKH